MTDAEKFLWSKLRGKQVHGFQWYRQRPVASYIVDFYCPCARLVIEVDGGQHYDESLFARDTERDVRLHMLGLTVLRFTNIDVLQRIDGVVMKIEKSLPTSLS
jgi:very-short-patch-repair endonuclease